VDITFPASSREARDWHELGAKRLKDFLRVHQSYGRKKKQGIFLLKKEGCSEGTFGLGYSYP
jgi:hypothetical protein